MRNAQKIIQKVQQLLKYHPDCGDLVTKGKVNVVYTAPADNPLLPMTLERIEFDYYVRVVVTDSKIEYIDHGAKKLFEYNGWRKLMKL